VRGFVYLVLEGGVAGPASGELAHREGSLCRRSDLVEACAHSVARVDTFSFKSFEENRNELEISSCSNLEMGNFRSGKKFHDL
jgi:hypothetical protein